MGRFLPDRAIRVLHRLANGLLRRGLNRISQRGWHYVLSLGLVAACTGLSAFLRQYISATNLVMIYLLTVVIAAGYLGRGPAILTSVLGVLSFDFFIIPPILSIATDDTEYILTFVTLLGIGLLISTLIARSREQLEAIRLYEAETGALYALSRDLVVAEEIGDIVQVIVANVRRTLAHEVIVFLVEDGALQCVSQGTNPPKAQEMAVAQWVMTTRIPAGWGTEHHATAANYYVPLATAQHTLGVLGVKPPGEQQTLTANQRRLLEALAGQAALAIERAQLAEMTHRAQLLEVTEKLQAALLNSISHDLRTPLVTITGALTTMDDSETTLNQQARRALIVTAREEAERLNRLVENLLDMTRLEAGAIRVRREPEDVQDVIGSALEELESRLGERPVKVDIPLDLPFVDMDFVLIVHVLVNIIDNALKYSPPGTPITIQARAVNREVEIQVIDQGIGIPEEDLEHIFDKFYRVQRPDHVSGTGLGLAISKGIVEAHGGRIRAENHPEGGAIIAIWLPQGYARQERRL
ncbi:MAG: DUF4118 domain-containing protein [Anaerolineae bacterium]|nr:DUF4118 domain-containing protein [Anaerolineae bacterium]